MRLYWLYPLAGLVLSIGTVLGFLAFRIFHSDADVSTECVYLTASTMAPMVILGSLLGRKEDRLLASSTTDPATALSNRRHFEERLHREVACAFHCKADLSLLMVDVDGLKSINDRLGHDVGDAALRLVAESLRLTCRSRDLAARWGGDEFVVLVPGTNAEQAATLAERIRVALGQIAASRHIETPLSVSIGISDLELAGSRRPADLFASADRALYCAKEEGRDRVSIARRSWARNTSAHKIASKEELNVHT